MITKYADDFLRPLGFGWGPKRGKKLTFLFDLSSAKVLSVI